MADAHQVGSIQLLAGAHLQQVIVRIDPLNIETPMLHVGNQVWKLCSASENSRDRARRTCRRDMAKRAVRESGALYERRIGEDRLFVRAEQTCVGIDAISDSNGGLARASRIPSDPNARPEVMPLIWAIFDPKDEFLSSMMDAARVWQRHRARYDVAACGIDLCACGRRIRCGVEVGQFVI